jgi:hypothetical protein
MASALKIAAGMIFALTMMAVPSRADTLDHASQLTFNEPVALPGNVLPAGTYWFEKLPNMMAPENNVVEVYNADHTQLIATLLTDSVERAQPAEHTTLRVAQLAANRPAELVTWFYPGDLEGDQFIYAPQQERQLQDARMQTIVASPGSVVEQ